jgi:hypothetical protein
MSTSRQYEIRIQGRLQPEWSAWFDGLTIISNEQATRSGETLLVGPVADQAALHGLLAKIRDLGLPLLSLTLVEPITGRLEGAGEAGGTPNERTRSTRAPDDPEFSREEEEETQS